jgi:hypothetical protein
MSLLNQRENGVRTNENVVVSMVVMKSHYPIVHQLDDHESMYDNPLHGLAIQVIMVLLFWHHHFPLNAETFYDIYFR